MTHAIDPAGTIVLQRKVSVSVAPTEAVRHSQVPESQKGFEDVRRMSSGRCDLKTLLPAVFIIRNCTPQRLSNHHPSGA